VPPVPRFLGVRVFEDYSLEDLTRYIDWMPFFNAWEFAGKFPDILTDPVIGEQASNLYADARRMLKQIIRERWLTARAVIGLFPAHSVDDDDVEVYADESRREVLARLHHQNIVAHRETLTVAGRSALLLKSAGSRTLAEKLFPQQSAIGRRLRVDLPVRAGDSGPDFEIVGVAADAATTSALSPHAPTVYFAYGQRSHSRMSLLVRGAGPLSTIEPGLRRALAAAAPEAAIVDLVDAQEQLLRSLHPLRINATLAVALAALGLGTAVAPRARGAPRARRPGAAARPARARRQREAGHRRRPRRRRRRPCADAAARIASLRSGRRRPVDARPRPARARRRRPRRGPRAGLPRDAHRPRRGPALRRRLTVVSG